MTRDEMLKVLAILGDAYPVWAEHASSSMPSTWLVLLGDLPVDRVLIAAVAHAQSNKFPPTPAELRERAAPPDDVVPEQAWALCLRASRLVSQHASDQRFAEVWRALRAKDHVAADALIAIGGFSLLFAQTNDAVSTNRAHFCRAYAALAARRRREGEARVALETLTGQHLLGVGGGA